MKAKIEYFCPKCKKIVKDVYGAPASAAPGPLQPRPFFLYGRKQQIHMKCDTPVVKLRRTKKKIKV